MERLEAVVLGGTAFIIRGKSCEGGSCDGLGGAAKADSSMAGRARKSAFVRVGEIAMVSIRGEGGLAGRIRIVCVIMWGEFHGWRSIERVDTLSKPCLR